MTQAQTQLIEELKIRKQEKARILQQQVAAIRKKITAASGKWDAVEVLHCMRYAE